MKKIILSCAVAFVAIFAACSDDDLLPTDMVNGTTAVGFADSVESFSYFEDEGQIERQLPVVLLANDGEPLTEDLTVGYEIDPSSTASAGTEFQFTNTTGTVTIPAGSTFVNLPILINTGSFNATQATRLVLNLKPQSDDVIAASSNAQIVINFVGCISVIQEGAYTATVQPGSSHVVGNTFQTTITMTGINSFTTSQTSPYVPGSNYQAGLPNYGFEFNDVCGDLTLSPGQTLFNYYTNPVTGVAFTSADGVLNGQQGKVIDANSFVLTHRIVVGTTIYTMYVKYSKNS